MVFNFKLIKNLNKIQTNLKMHFWCCTNHMFGARDQQLAGWTLQLWKISTVV